MNTYDIESEAYLGTGEDAAKHAFHAFRIDQEIHIVYHLGEDNQHIAKADIDKVASNIEAYIWTPFAQFAFPKSLNTG